MIEKTVQKKLTQQQAIVVERDLAKFANTMDSLVRIPFTKQGLGADAALSTVPLVGDLAGFALTLYAFKKAKEVGVPQHKLNGVVKLAIVDMLVGDIHVIHPFLHESLEQKQKTSAFWRNPVVSWIWLRMPDLLGLIVLILLGIALWAGGHYAWQLYQSVKAN